VVFGGEGSDHFNETLHCRAEQECLDIFDALRVKEDRSLELAGDFVDEQAHLSIRFL
jgi:hypothetical protein